MALLSYCMKHTVVVGGIMFGGKKLRVVLGLHMCPLAKELMIHFVVYILVSLFIVVFISWKLIHTCIYSSIFLIP